jgi:molybdenum cofactor cytidylyltransferase
MRIVINPEYMNGQSTSLRAGLAAAGSDAEAAVVVLGDQPDVHASTIRAVVREYERSGKPVVQALYGGRPGHPLLFDRSLWADLSSIQGDRGARDLLKEHPNWIARVEVNRDLPPDLDTWEDYEKLRSRSGNPVTQTSSRSTPT